MLVCVSRISVILFIFVLKPNCSFLLIPVVSLRFNSSYEKAVVVLHVVNVAVWASLVDWGAIIWN